MYLSLLSLHNTYFMVGLILKIRKSLENGAFLSQKKNFLRNTIQETYIRKNEV
ncbi:hypothetical protein [Candidatus Endomicrobiellum trichonymphae]|uniref:hypothetical protein n=1 Tax=Endomicrobium trichonymphae TaxID=1408204 RepID=UPI000F6587C3